MTVRTPPTSFHPVQVQDFTVTTDGVGFVSQVATASLCGVTKQAVSKLVKREELSGCRVNLNENSQLDEKTLVLVVGYYASKGNKTAIDTMFKMMQAGARAFIYHQAGYHIQATEQARVDALEAQVKALTQAQAQTHQQNISALKSAILNSHATLQKWVVAGYLECDAKTRTEYKYTLTEHGAYIGFTQNRNGTVIPPASWTD